MGKLSSFMIQLEKWLAKALLTGIVVLVLVAAIFRAAGYPIVWSVEMAQLLFPWFVFLAANQSLRQGSHIGVDVLTRYLPQKWQRGIELIHLVFMAVFLIVLAVCGIKLSIENWGRMINTLSISYSFITLSLSFGSFTMLITVISRMKEFLSGKEKHAYVTEKYVS